MYYHLENARSTIEKHIFHWKNNFYSSNLLVYIKFKTYIHDTSMHILYFTNQVVSIFFLILYTQYVYVMYFNELYNNNVVINIILSFARKMYIKHIIKLKSK